MDSTAKSDARKTGHPGWTTASVEMVPQIDPAEDTVPGFVLVYSQLHPHLPSAFPLHVNELTIGREAGNGIAIGEGSVSRRHARIEVRRDGVWIVDLGSTNGTLVNGSKIESHCLEDHDLVRVGDTLLRFAGRSIHAYAGYRVDGQRVDEFLPQRRTVREPLLVGGYQIDAFLDRIAKVAPTDLAVVIRGESGTGKELAARQLHFESRRSGPFLAVNCAALPANLLESELFGYRRGAFTGAASDKIGLVRAADRGTLFLDEIGDMPLDAQAKLLRVLQEREVTPVGATAPERVDVRVVCATHRDLENLVRDGRFRGDLLARLRDCVLELPPLRQRREDLLPLVRHFFRCEGRLDARPTFAFMLALAHYDWPYNVRELESAVKLALTLADGPELHMAHLPEHVQSALVEHGRRPRVRMSATASGLQRAAPSEQDLRELLHRHGGNIAAVGRELGKERMQIHRWLKRYGIHPAEYRDG